MTDDTIEILLAEYKVVNEHWTLATKQKAMIIQVCGTVIMALLGASMLEHLSWGNFAAISLGIVILGAYIYAQKEAEYWVAAICLESLEYAINGLSEAELLGYVGRFKTILFRRKKSLSLSPFRILHLVRISVGSGFAVLCCVLIYEEYGWAILSMYIVMSVGSLIYLAYASQYTMRKAQDEMDGRIHAARRTSAPSDDIERAGDEV